MKFTVFVALLLARVGAITVHDEQASVAAVQKVIQMLGDMAAKAKQEKNDEEVAFSEFSQWCESEQANLKNSIAKSGEAIEGLTAEIAKLTTEGKVLGEEIAQLNSDVADYEADLKASKEQRAKDNVAFLAESQDYSESVDAIERAIVVLQKQSYDRPALLQLAESAQLPEKAKAMVQAFAAMMQDDDDPMDYKAPEANAYEFQSGSIVSMLQKLRDEFRTKLADSQKEEMNSKHAFDMQSQDLTDSVENSKSDIEEKTAVKQRKAEKAAIDKKELAETQLVKAADESTLKDVKTECAEKKFSYDEKQQLRAEEISAIEQAIKILNSEAAKGGEQYLSAAQTKVATSLAQFRGTNENAQETEGIRRRLRDFLESEGVRLHSSQISLLAAKIAADPFAKVKKMIDDMITRLLEEAHADADHEGFCDTEVGKSKITRAKLTEDIDALTAAVEEGKATILALTEEVATLTKEVAELDSSMLEATKMRTAEKSKNEATVEDCAAAEKAVQAAIAILKKFYADASTATALVQADGTRPSMGSDEWDSLANPNFEGTIDKGHKSGMQTFGKTFQGQQDEAGGVLAMLEVIQSDFATVQADTKAEEASNQKAYDGFMTESQRNKATKEKKIEMDQSDKAAAETKLQEDTKDMKFTQDQLLAADRYYAKLVPQCFDKGMTFEERTAARESEIASLKQALQILGSA